MKADERQHKIVERLFAQGSVEVSELCVDFDVSKMTIHRDLDVLERDGVLRRTRGGATIEFNSQIESDYRYRERIGISEKKRLCRAALDLVQPGMIVLINDGTTTSLLGEMLVEKRPVTVITNSMTVIESLTGKSGVTLISLGGTYSEKYKGFFGVVTEEALSQVRADIAFITSPAVSETQTFHMDHDAVRTKRKMIEASVDPYLIVDHMKFGRTALHFVADLTAFSGVITDKTPAPNFEEALKAAEVEVIVAEESGDGW